MSKRKNTQGLQRITKFFKLSDDKNGKSTSKVACQTNVSENLRVPAKKCLDEKLAQVSKEANLEKKTQSEAESSEILPEENCLKQSNDIEIIDSEDNTMYPQYNYGNPSQGGGMNPNYYNSRHDVGPRYREFQGHGVYLDRDGNFSRRENAFQNNFSADYCNYGGDQFNSDFQNSYERSNLSRPPIHGNRYDGNDADVRYRSHDQYINNNNLRQLRNVDNSTERNPTRTQHGYQRSQSFESHRPHHGIDKSYSYDGSRKRRTSPNYKEHRRHESAHSGRLSQGRSMQVQGKQTSRNNKSSDEVNNTKGTPRYSGSRSASMAFSPEESTSMSPAANKSMSSATNRDMSQASNRGVLPEANKDMSLAANKDMSSSANKGMSPAVNRDMSAAANKGMSPVANKDMSSLANKGMSSAVNRDMSSAANKGMSPAANKGKSPSVNKDMSLAANKGMSPAVNRDVSLAANKGMSSAANKDMSSAINKGMSPGVKRDMASAANKDMASAANKDMSPAANKDVSTAANKGMSPAANKDMSSAINKGMSPAANKGLSIAACDNKTTETTSPSSVIVGNIYKSDQYFSGMGEPEVGEKIKSPFTKKTEKKSSVTRTPESNDKKGLKSPLQKNQKMPVSDIGGSPKYVIDQEKVEHSVSKRESAPNVSSVETIATEQDKVKMQESGPILSSEEFLTKAKNKIDLSTIKKALIEVNSKQESPKSTEGSSPKISGSTFSQAKEITNNVALASATQERGISEESLNIVKKPTHHPQRNISVEKCQNSPRSRNSSGDSQGMLSPKLLVDLKQRSAFHAVQVHIPTDSLSDISSPSPQGSVSPLDRKKCWGMDVSIKQRVDQPTAPQHEKQKPSHKKNRIDDSKTPRETNEQDESQAWSQISVNSEASSDGQESQDADISLKSATSYKEWRRLKAIRDAAQQKEVARQRPCIELANTPEEYRSLLKQQKQKAKAAREKSKSSKNNSENEMDCSETNGEAASIPPLHNTENSFQAIQDVEENAMEESSDDDIFFEDSDDDDLEAPSFLFSLEEASTRPIPGTPTKLSSRIESPDMCSPLPEPDVKTPIKKILSSKFSLDQLVSEKIDKSEDQRALEDMHSKLEEGLKKGGFIKDTLEEPVEINEDLLPEQENVVKKFQIFDSVISDIHPGDVIFKPLLYQSRFTGALSLQSCGFIPGTSYTDKYLSTLQPKDYSMLLASNILKNTLERVSCLESVLRWVFLLMSIHNNELLTNGCHKVLIDHLTRQVHFHEASQTWVPTISDVLSVFCNYGCEVDALLPESLVDSKENISYGMIQEEINGNVDQGGNYNCRNLHLVLEILGQALHASPRYSNRELTQLLVILCRTAMDITHHREILPHEYQLCIRGILRCYTSNYWDSNCKELCHILFGVTNHHHNRLYLVQLFPEDRRGSYIQRRLSFLFLQDMFDTGRDTDITHFKIKSLHVFLPKLHNLVTEDVYKLSSAIKYLDKAVGNGSIKVAEKQDLQYLSDQLKKISGEIKDSVRMLDRSWVKDMMVRVCSKWTLYLLSVGSKQRSIFAYAKKKTPALKIKTVEAVQEDVSSHSEEEDDSETVPNRVSIESDELHRDSNSQVYDENSNTSDYKTMQNNSKNKTCSSEINDDIVKTVTVKVESPVIIPVDCDSPMEVDLTLDEDLPDLL